MGELRWRSCVEKNKGSIQFGESEMQEVPFNVVDTLMFNGQGLFCEQIFEHNDWGGFAYHSLAEFVNNLVQFGVTVNNIIPSMQARFNSVSAQPFPECNRLTITQFEITVYYDPDDVIDTINEEDERQRRLNDDLRRMMNPKTKLKKRG